MNNTYFKSLLTEAIQDFKEVKKNNFLHEFREHTFNNASLVPINEKNVKNLIDKHSDNGYIIVSACRGGADFNLNPKKSYEDKLKLGHINKERTKKLIEILNKSQYSYTPVYGGFKENAGTPDEEIVYEKSFIVYNYDKQGNPTDMKDLATLGQEICSEFNQDSFLAKAPNSTPQYITSAGELDFEPGENLSFNDYDQDYFTDLHKNTHNYKGKASKATRFTFHESYVNPAPQCYSERLARAKNGEIFID